MVEAVTAQVDVKRDWASKINWTSVVSAVAVITALFGFDIPQDMQLKIVGFLGIATPVVTVVLRTWFTTKLTASSAPK
jgi:hypothetical protein